MSEGKLEAQRRGEYNDTVHLFQEWVEIPQCGGGRDVRKRALCRNDVYKDDSESNDISPEDVIERDYLIIDDEIIGELCGNCQTVLRAIL